MPNQQKTSAKIAVIGIDIGKTTFQLIGQDERGAIVMRAKVSRRQLAVKLSNLQPCIIGMEPCSGAHYIARRLLELGHDVRLVPGQYVKPFLKAHKNDYRDAEAVAEAVQRPTMDFVAVKTPEQSDLLSLHRIRSRLVRHRTALINQIRGILMERGITVRQGPAPMRAALVEILSQPPSDLSPRIQRLLCELGEDWRRLDDRIDAMSDEIEALAKDDTACQRLMTVPGIGVITASAMVAAIGNGHGFKQGRDFAAWIGLVPRQDSTGGRTKLGRLSKRGNKHLRTLFIQAAHVVLARKPAAAKQALWPWVERASGRLAHRNLLATALANKLARIAWAVLVRGHDYRPEVSTNVA
jgi:transposase